MRPQRPQAAIASVLPAVPREVPPPVHPRPERSRVVVRPATPDDMDFTSRTHLKHLPYGLFPQLGPAFLRRWHATFLGTPEGIALVAVRTGGEAERTVGFLVGSLDQVALTHHVLLHHRVRLGAAGAWSLLVRPRVALHFLRTRAATYARRLMRSPALRKGQDGPPGAERPDGDLAPVAVLTALAITPEERGSGAGAALVAAFVDQARAAGVVEAWLTTLAGEGGAGGFYEALGWRRREVHPTRDGVLMATYRADLTSLALGGYCPGAPGA